MNRVSEGEFAAIWAAYEEHVRAVCEGAYPSALQLSGRLDPQRWVLEWNLAGWVGAGLGVPAGTWRKITLSNALILASVVWQDDLEDGELRVADRDAARRIGEGLFHAAMEPYRELIPAESPFWQAIDRWMEAWRAATADAAASDAAATGARAYTALPTDLSPLAVRGAPLKVPALGLCVIADRAHAFPALEASIDHALTGMVLYDHFVDWMDDLAAHRWNAFVAFALGERPTRWTEPTMVAVRAAMLAQRRLLSEYFDLIDAELAAAEQSAAQAGVGELALHFHDVASELRREGSALGSRYGSLGERATQVLFGRQSITA
jgi:hypothetical protein